MSVSEKAVRQARQADLVQYLRSRGYELKKEGQNYRVVSHGGLIVQGNHWRHFSSNQGGNTLDFLVKVLGLDFKAAIEQLAGAPPAEVSSGPTPGQIKKSLELPVRARNERRVIAYLTKTRGLPADLVVELIRTGMIYQDEKGNCVFPCRDAAGQAHGAILNGTLSDVRFKGNAPGSDISYGWWWPVGDAAAGTGADLVTVTEGPIDVMSLVVLRPGCRHGHVLALGGLHKEAVDGFLSRLKISRVVLALDNDQPGVQAVKEWQEWLIGEGYKVWILKPIVGKKDWNECLKTGGLKNGI